MLSAKLRAQGWCLILCLRVDCGLWAFAADCFPLSLLRLGATLCCSRARRVILAPRKRSGARAAHFEETEGRLTLVRRGGE